MGRASDWSDRALLAGRRLSARPESPLVAAAILGALAVAETVLRSNVGPDLSPELLLSVCATAPVALIRFHRGAAAGAVTVATVLTLAAGERPTLAGGVAQLVVLYLLGRDRSRRARGRALQRQASRRAIADSLLEHAARGERARIARELHDVVAHHLSIISIQAETARLTTPGLPPLGAQRLTAIGDTARTALVEMRRLLGVLREDAGVLQAPDRPQPGLARLNDLIDEARAASGASTRLILRSPVIPLDPGVELTAYRIIQEALTNTRRHAPGAAVDVELDYGDGSLAVRVRDNGPGPRVRLGARELAGHGLLGMRERATMVGGELTVGRAATGGFLVEATLPMAAP